MCAGRLAERESADPEPVPAPPLVMVYERPVLDEVCEEAVLDEEAESSDDE